MVKPLVPSGILGPFGLNLGDDVSEWADPLDCGDPERTPRPLCVGVRIFDFPRNRAHPFFEPSSAYQYQNQHQHI